MLQEMRKVCGRLLRSLFAVVARDYLQALLKGAAFYELCTSERNFKEIKILSSLRSKMSPEISFIDPRQRSKLQPF